jgi:signal transduction histidine kinase
VTRMFAALGSAVRDIAGRICAARGFPAPKWGAPGPAMAVIWSVVARVASVVRGAAAVYVVVQVVIWHDYYAAHPWYLAGPVAAVAWGGAAAVYLRRRRPAWPLIVADSSFYAALAISSGICVPPEMRGVAGNWLYIVLVGQVVVTVWFAPRVLAVLLGLVPEAAYWASAAVTPPGPAQGNAPVVSSVLLLVVLIIHWAGRSMLYRRAAQADRGFAAADSEAHDQYVVLSRNIERREHERLLHDTVLNTLTAISRGSSGAMVVARCRHDIALLEHALADPARAAEPAAPGGATLVADVETVAGEMRARGLRVILEVAGRGGPDIPPPVAGAIVSATREALANVAAHAGTGEAWVTITLGAGPPGAGSPGGGLPDAGTGGVQVCVRDAGTGFDPARVDPARLGLRRSITERVADWGGRVSVRSAPGQGTVVDMSWPAALPAAGAQLVAADSSW